MGNTSNMKVPYYILVNDEDRLNPKFYHECSYSKTPYESVYGDEIFLWWKHKKMDMHWS